VIAACGAILLVAPARVENGTRIGIAAETITYRQGLVVFWRPSWFRMNPGLPFLSRGCCGQLGLRLALSGRGALGLLYCGALKEPAKFVVDLSPFRSGWLWHCSEEYCHRGDVLASPSEEWGLIGPFVVVDAAIDVASPVSGCSTVTPDRVLLVEGGTEVHQLLVVLVDLGLELVELLEFGLLRPHGSRHRGPLSRGPRG
jgi:hypothetical protein